MFHSRIMNIKTNRLHERCLRRLYGDKSSSFEKLLEQDKSVTIHTRNLQILATKIFKVYRIYLLPYSVIFFISVVIIIIYESIKILQCQT